MPVSGSHKTQPGTNKTSTQRANNTWYTIQTNKCALNDHNGCMFRILQPETHHTSI